MKVNLKQKIFLVLALILFIFWGILFLTGSVSGSYNNVFELLFGLPSIFSGIIAIMNASSWSEEKTIRKGMTIAGLGLVFWGVGCVIWAGYNFFLGVPTPYPSLSDFFYLPSTLLYSIGVIYFARASGSDLKFKTNDKIFATVATVIISTVSFYILVTIARGGKLFYPEDSAFANFLNIAYPCTDFVALVVAVFVSGFSLKYIIPKYKIAIMSLTAGLAAMLVADSLFVYFVIHGTWKSAGLSDLLYLLATSLLIFGVLGFCHIKSKETQRTIHAFKFLKYR